MAEFHQQLKKAMSIRNISQAELCEKTKIPKSAMSQYVSGSFKPKQERTYLIAKALNVNEAWLMGYEDVLMDIQKLESNIQSLDQSKVYNIPVFESVSAGFGAYANDYIVDYMPIYVSNPADAKDMLCIKVKGDSMYPKIEDGDTVVVRKQSSVDSGSIAVVLIDNEEGFVKKVVYSENLIELISINPEYAPKRFEGENVLRVSVVGVVKQIIKEV